MNYLSLFSGIEAASVAWSNLDWNCVGFSEIDPFACAVLQHHYPNTPNLGNVSDITEEKINEIKEKYGAIDVVVGGSPCQSFSVAGNRQGLDDLRGQLMFQYIRVVGITRPKWFIWENVGGALSSNKGKDFACLLEEMAKFGYALCWRVLDSQYFGIPQRRRRIFLVGCLGNPNGSYEVLFERKSGNGDNKKSREKGERNTSKTQRSIGEHDKSNKVTMLESNQNNASISENAKICFTLKASMGMGGGHTPMVVDDDYCSVFHSKHLKEHSKCPTLIARIGTGGNNLPMVLDNDYSITHDLDHNIVSTLCARDYKGVATHDLPKGQKLIPEKHIFTQNTRSEVRYIGGHGQICGALSATSGMNQTNYVHEDTVFVSPNGQIYSEIDYMQYKPTSNVATIRSSTPQNNNLHVESAIGCDLYNTSIDTNGKCTTLTAHGNATGSGPRVIVKKQAHSEVDVSAPISKGNGECWENNKTFSSLSGGGGIAGQGYACVRVESRVRRLTPMECERLQGFPDGWTEIPYRGKEAKDCPMSPRYKALGNSMAVPVMQWIGERIDLFSKYGNCDNHNFIPINKCKKKSID